MNKIMLKKRIYVLYGSQTGNAESIAKEFNENLERNGFISKCLTLNSTSVDDMKQNADYITIICSTTGNGDAPENADAFWRTIKKRTLPKDLLTGLQFSVLGLGDTNYDKFCFMGKALDKRFSELGATRFLNLHCADEATDLEEVVESWKIQCEKLIQKMESDSIQLESTAKLIEDITLNPNTGENNNKTNDNGTKSPSDDIQTCDADSKILPNGVLNLSEIVKHFNISVDLSTTPDSSLLPKSRRNNENNFEIVAEGKTQPSSTLTSSSSLKTSPTISTNFQDKQNLTKPTKGRSSSNTSEWTVENPFHAPINYAKWLTRPPNLSSPLCPTKSSEEAWEHSRDVILVDINIHLSGIQYQPGDSIAICVPNPEKLINCVLERLQSSTITTTTTATTVENINENKSNIPLFQKDTIIRKLDGEELSLFELLSYRLDLVSVPRKATVLALAECCKDENEANALRWVCTKGEIGKTLWKNLFEDQCVGVGELLALYPSCTPSLQTLIAILSPLPPRAYSIATSPLLHPSSVEVALSLVRYCCVSGGYQSTLTTSSTETRGLKVIKRSGLCTSYLHNLLKKWLYPSTHSNDPTPSPIRIIHKPSATFRLPGSVASPLVLIGPGTGVAPFIGFLSHRAALEKERRVSGEDTCTGMWRGGYELAGTCDLPCEGNRIDEFIQHVQPGDIHLYFGCRNEEDWIFRESMEMRLDEGTLTVLETALSRIGPEKVYVTHKLKSRGKELTDLILESNAYVYICGDGCHMAKDVTNTLMQIIEENSNLTQAEIQKLFESMKQRRRFLLDIWS
mmetsp:Transcript_770/g.765  ORF Transcript_770/g.765 Transcript_770/m.765 type:complete len:799 (+) Transcript_770:68-2464(+)